MQRVSIFSLSAMVIVVIGTANWPALVSGCGKDPPSTSERSSASTSDSGATPAARSYIRGRPLCDQVQLLHCQRLESLVDIIPQTQWPEYLGPGIRKCEVNGIFEACGLAPSSVIATTTTIKLADGSRP